MRICDLFSHTDHQIDEALGKWATLAALGVAGVAGLGALGGSGSSDTPDMSPISTAQAARTPQTVPPPVTRAHAPNQVHPNFPRELHSVASMNANDRVATFQNTMLPLIRAENQHIQNDRQRVRVIENNRAPSPQDRAWLNQKMADYGVTDVTSLMRRMDVIPPSLVLAQSAIESGWGTDQIARTGNAFFGQRAVRDQGHTIGPQGERYRSYESPQHSVRSYMKNLNTHRAYEALRAERTKLRRQGKTPTGVELAVGLLSYSTRGADYVQQVQRLIRSRDLGRFDRG
jgi:Bax protein